MFHVIQENISPTCYSVKCAKQTVQHDLSVHGHNRFRSLRNRIDFSFTPVLDGFFILLHKRIRAFKNSTKILVILGIVRSKTAGNNRPHMGPPVCLGFVF